MKNDTGRNRVKGFTLIEMIIVIAILAILVGILAPSMMSYYRSSRIKEANTDAKMVYNAAQTEVMRYMSSDRTTLQKSGFLEGMWIAYTPNGEIRYASGPNTPSAASAMSVASDSDTDSKAVAARTVARRVNTMVSGSGNVCWSVYVNNYIVQGCTSASSNGSANVGFYSANKQTASPAEQSSGTYQNVFLTRLTNITSGYSAQGITDSSVSANSNKTSGTGNQSTTSGNGTASGGNQGTGYVPGGNQGTGYVPGGNGQQKPGGDLQSIYGSASAAHMGQNGQ